MVKKGEYVCEYRTSAVYPTKDHAEHKEDTNGMDLAAT